MISTTLHYAARRYWSKWKSSGKPPGLQTMHKMFSGVFAQEFGSTGKLDEVMRRARPLLSKFVDTHPIVEPLLVGTSFETPFPIPGAKVILKDSLDLVYRSRRGTENLIVIATNLEHERSMIKPTVSLIGYQSMRGSNPHVMKVFREKSGFSNIKITQKNLDSLVSTAELLSTLHNNKIKAKHIGLACNACPYSHRCWR